LAQFRPLYITYVTRRSNNKNVYHRKHIDQRLVSEQRHAFIAFHCLNVVIFLQRVFYTVERKNDIVVSDTVHVAATNEIVTDRERWVHVALGQLIYHFLAHVIDIKRSNLVDKLVTKEVISPDERGKIKEQKQISVRVNNLMMTLREKSAAEFERFLATLSGTGQQSVADVVRQALHTVGQTGQNPLQHLSGKPVYCGVQV